MGYLSEKNRRSLLMKLIEETPNADKPIPYIVTTNKETIRLYSISKTSAILTTLELSGKDTQILNWCIEGEW